MEDNNNISHIFRRVNPETSNGRRVVDSNNEQCHGKALEEEMDYIFSNPALSFRGVGAGYDAEGGMKLDFSNPALSLPLKANSNITRNRRVGVETPPVHEIFFRGSRKGNKRGKDMHHKKIKQRNSESHTNTDHAPMNISETRPRINPSTDDHVNQLILSGKVEVDDEFEIEECATDIARTHVSSSTTSTPDASFSKGQEWHEFSEKSESMGTNKRFVMIACIIGFALSLIAGALLLIGPPATRLSDDGIELNPTDAPTQVYTPPPVHGLDLDLSLPDTSTGFWTPKGQFSGVENVHSGQLGTQVAISFSGTSVAISAPYGEQNAGQVHVYELNEEDNQWYHLGDPIIGASSSHSGESIALSGSGKILAIGSLFASNSRGISNTGTVEFYKWNGLSWELLGVSLEGEQENEQFGSALSLSADGMRAAVGSWRKSVKNQMVTGEVRIYEYNAHYNEWILLGFPLTGLQDGDQFGRSVSFNASGNRIAVGAPKAYANSGDNSVLNPGHVRVFDLHHDQWVQVGSPTTGLVSRGSFGATVSLSGDGLRLSVSSATTLFSSIGEQEGEVRVYANNNAEWRQIGQAMVGEASDDGTPMMLSFDGSKLAVASDFGVRGRGGVRAYEFNPDANVWKLLGSMVHFSPAGDSSESSLALSASGYQIIMADDSGSVRILEF